MDDVLANQGIPDRPSRHFGGDAPRLDGRVFFGEIGVGDDTPEPSLRAMTSIEAWRQ